MALLLECLHVGLFGVGSVPGCLVFPEGLGVHGSKVMGGAEVHGCS